MKTFILYFLGLIIMWAIYIPFDNFLVDLMVAESHKGIDIIFGFKCAVTMLIVLCEFVVMAIYTEKVFK